MKIQIGRPALLLLIVGILLPLSTLAGWEEEGLASWYGGRFQGRTTASGEIFDTNQMTAAHKTLPFGTKVRVTEVESGRSVVVRINDRGPYAEGRVIDLSRAAALEIGLVAKGIAPVRVTLQDSPVPAEMVTLQVGAYREALNAERAVERLQKAGFFPQAQQRDSGVFRILLPDIPSETADSVILQLSHIGFSGVFIRK